jgi:HPt (histidine-containing phosphotransfer) domain-containing protein
VREADHETPHSEAELLAEIFREFREGLPDRLDTMRAALATLADGGEPAAVELFYRTAHSLKGTAPSFDADELVEPAASLADIGLSWYEGAAPSADEIAAAQTVLEQLSEAVQSYAERMEGNTSG